MVLARGAKPRRGQSMETSIGESGLERHPLAAQSGLDGAHSAGWIIA